MKKPLSSTSLLILLGSAIVSGSSLGQQPPAAAQPESIGQVVWVKGTVKAIAADKTSRDLQRRGPIYVHDTIVTDKTSTGQIVFTDNTILALSVDTQLAIDQYKFGKNVPPDQSKYVATLAKGGFRTITGLITKNNPNNYQVNTPVATIGVGASGYKVALTNCTPGYQGESPKAGKYGSSCKLSMGWVEGHPFIKNDTGKYFVTPETKFLTVNAPNIKPNLVKIAPVELNNIPALKVTTYTVTPPAGPAGGAGAGGGKPTKTGEFCLAPA